MTRSCGHEQASDQSRSQIGFKTAEGLRVQYFRRNVPLSVIIVLAPDFRHLFVVGCNPNGATLLVLNIHWQLGTQSLPELLRVTRQRKLRLGVVHRDNVAHAGCGRSAADHGHGLRPRRAYRGARIRPRKPRPQCRHRR